MTTPTCSLKVVDSQGLGRHYITESRIEPGDTVVIEDPFLIVVKDASVNKVCACCLRMVSGSGIPCAQCELATCCSEVCQSQHRDRHVPVCRFVRMMDFGDSETEMIRTLIALLPQVMAGEGPIHALCDNLDNINEISPDARDYFEDVATAVDTVASHPQCPIAESYSAAGITVDKLVIIAARVMANAFSVQPVGAPSAIAKVIYSQTSLFNHSCAPNCTWTNINSEGSDHPGRMVVRAIARIEPGTPVTLCYTHDILQPTTIRQPMLASGYLFRCACVRCRSDSGDRDRHALESALGLALPDAHERLSKQIIITSRVAHAGHTDRAAKSARSIIDANDELLSQYPYYKARLVCILLLAGEAVPLEELAILHSIIRNTFPGLVSQYELTLEQSDDRSSYKAGESKLDVSPDYARSLGMLDLGDHGLPLASVGNLIAISYRLATTAGSAELASRVNQLYSDWFPANEKVKV